MPGVITIRMSPAQHRALKDAAHASRRSMNEFVMQRLFPDAEFPSAPGSVEPKTVVDKALDRAAAGKKREATPSGEQVPGHDQATVPGDS